MPFTPELIAELRILNHYNLDSTSEGLKIHASAGSDVVAAVQRLHERGLVTQPDGGYLTDRGVEAAEHVQAALNLLCEH